MSFAGIEFASGDPDRGRWLISGLTGSGKTTLASTIAECGKTLFVDLVGEKGTRVFQGAPYASNIDVVRPTSVTDLDDVFWTLNGGQHDYEAVVLDSLTGLQKMAMRYLLGHSETAVKEIAKGGATAEFRTWGQALDIMTDTATFWYGLADGNRSRPLHVVMTTQVKEELHESTGEIVHYPDVQRGARSIVLSTPDYVVYCDVLNEELDEDAEPMHIVRFGSNPTYRMKARIPHDLRGKIPSVLGKKGPTSLTTLSRILRIGGVPENKTNTKTTKVKEN